LPLRRRAPPPAAAPKRRPPLQPPASALPPRGESTPALPAPAARLDRLADSVVKAVRDFGDRGALFERRQLACDGLARGLLAVENRWLTYGTARRAFGVPDPARAASGAGRERSEEHTSEPQSRFDLACRRLLENK